MELRCTPISSDASRSPSRRSGSGLKRVIQEVSSHPVRSRSRLRYAAAVVSAMRSAPAACASTASMSRFAFFATPPAPLTPAYPSATERMSASMRAVCAVCALATFAIAARRSSMPSPVRVEVGTTWTLVRPSSRKSPAYESATVPTSPAASRSDLFSTANVTAEWLACGRMNWSWMTESAYFSGSETHTSTSTWPARRSAMARLDASTESKSGRSNRISGPAPRANSPWRARRSSTPSQSSSSSEPSGSQMAASGEEVVGRRAAALPRSSPTTALNSEVLPEPVAPKKPTTVWSPDSARRSAPAFATRSRPSRLPGERYGAPICAA